MRAAPAPPDGQAGPDWPADQSSRGPVRRDLPCSKRACPHLPARDHDWRGSTARSRRAGRRILRRYHLPVSDDGDARCSGDRQTGRCICRVEPTAALFFSEGPFLAEMLLAANVTEEYRIDKSEQPAIMGVYRNHGMQI